MNSRIAYQTIWDCCQHTAEVYDALKYLQALAEMPSEKQWIPCSERLPRYNEYVLVYRPEMAIKMIVDCYGEGEGWTYSKDDAVVAWMPLPEPYKKEGEPD